jgi:hypothetical protein
MPKQKLGRMISRTRKRDFGVRKHPLPDKYSFLNDIPFYSITVCELPDSKIHQDRVEFLPRELRKLSESFILEKENSDRLYKQKSELKTQNKQFKLAYNLALDRIKELEEYTEKLLKNNNIMVENEQSYIDDRDFIFNSDCNSHLQRMMEQNIELRRCLPISGGIPDSGKKR